MVQDQLSYPIGASLLSAIDKARYQLEVMADQESSIRPAPGKWSKKEILGHLIDSACNNHRRFVLAPGQDSLVFDGYDQEAWVERQNYQAADWQELVNLWYAYNRHLARMVDLIPPDILLKEHHEHNLDQLAWQPVPLDQPATLAYFIRDYIGHLEHHLRQILTDF